MPQSSSSNIAVVAAVQAAPIYINLERSLSRAVDLIAEAARRHAQLVVFPESWLSGYPAWLDTCRDVALWDYQPMKRLYARLLENSVVIPSRATEALDDAARKHNLTLIIGANERVGGTIYNSILTFGPGGELLNVHRKLIPTFNERLIWAQGDGKGLQVIETPIGRIGGLICWEHWMPLVRQKLHTGYEEIHAALWPSVKEMNQIASRHYAFEGRCFVVAAGGIMRHSDLPHELEFAANLAGEDSEYILNGGSAIIGPDGQYVAGPAFGSEVIILARINLDRVREENLTMDVAGHYNRPDLFEFKFKPDDEAKAKSEVKLEASRQAIEKTGNTQEHLIEVPAPSLNYLLNGRSESGSPSHELQSPGAEVLRPTGTESLMPDAPPALRMVTSNKSSKFDSEIHELGNRD